MDQWISLISGLSAFITALATLYVILEMKRQRASTYLPDLAFPIVGLHLYKASNGYFFFSVKEKLEEIDRRS